MKSGWCVVFLLIPLFFSGCGLVTTQTVDRPSDTAEAAAFLSELKKQNDRLQTFKGIGRIKLIDGEIKTSSRMAWMGMAPLNLRIEIMGAPGYRTASLSTDGKSVYLLSHENQRFYKKRLSGASLKEILSISVKLTEIYEFLSGRVPIQKHHRVVLEKSDSEEYVLVLKNRWRTELERISINKPVIDENDKIEISARKVEMFDTTGTFLYRASVDRMKTVGDYRIPFNLTISNEDGVLFRLEIERFWVDVPVSPNAFVLAPPE
jgi:outer membrane biogenesis lipoprotein LolB